MTRDDFLYMTWAELFSCISRSAKGFQPYPAVAMLQDALQAILTVRLPELQVTVTANPADSCLPSFWVADILVSPTDHNPVIRAMAPFALCQAELFHVPGLILLHDTGGAWELSFSCDGDRRQLLNRPVGEWADDVVSRGIRGSIRVRYLDPLISLCSQLSKLPANRREKFLAYCTHLSIRYEPLAAPILEKGIPNTFEARDTLLQFEERLGVFREEDFVTPRGIDPMEMRNTSWSWFQEAVKPWMGDYKGSVTAQQNAQALFSGFWSRLTNGSRGAGYYTGTPRSFYISTIFFDKSGVWALKEFPLMSTRQVLGLLFQDLPDWAPKEHIEQQPSTREDIIAQLEAANAWAAEATLPMVRRTCLVMDWRDGSGVQYADLAYCEQNITPKEPAHMRRQRKPATKQRLPVQLHSKSKLKI